jgi:hypothetical protein
VVQIYKKDFKWLIDSFLRKQNALTAVSLHNEGGMYAHKTSFTTLPFIEVTLSRQEIECMVKYMCCVTKSHNPCRLRSYFWKNINSWLLTYQMQALFKINKKEKWKWKLKKVNILNLKWVKPCWLNWEPSEFPQTILFRLAQFVNRHPKNAFNACDHSTKS